MKCIGGIRLATINTAILVLATAFIFLILLTFESCIINEDDLASQNCTSCATIRGTVTTDDGKQPLADVEITATWKHTVYLGRGIIRKKASTRTDSYGNYKLNFEIREDEMENGYFICEAVVGNEYYNCHENELPSFSLFELTNDSIVIKDIYIPYVAYLNIGASGAEKMADSDYFSVTIIPTVKSNPNVCGHVFGWNNRDPDWIHKITAPANQDLIVETSMRKGDVSAKEYDTLFIQRGQTAYYTAIFN